MENNEVKFEEIKQDEKKKESFGQKAVKVIKWIGIRGFWLGLGAAAGYVGRKYLDKETYEAAERQWAHERKMAERNSSNN